MHPWTMFWQWVLSRKGLVLNLIILTLHALVMGIKAQHLTGSIADGIIVAILLLTQGRESAKAVLLLVILILSYQVYATIPIAAKAANTPILRGMVRDWVSCGQDAARYLDDHRTPAEQGDGDVRRLAAEVVELTCSPKTLPIITRDF